MSYTTGSGSNRINNLQSQLSQLQEESRVLRSALEEAKDSIDLLWAERIASDNTFFPSKHITFGRMLRISDALKSTPLSAQYQERIKSMEAFIESFRLWHRFISKHNDRLGEEVLFKACLADLAALDSLSEREKEGL